MRIVDPYDKVQASFLLQISIFIKIDFYQLGQVVIEKLRASDTVRFSFVQQRRKNVKKERKAACGCQQFSGSGNEGVNAGESLFN